MIELILTALLALPAYHADREPPEVRTARLTVIAGAIAEASEHATCSAPWSTPECVPVWRGSSEQLAALLVAIAWHESTLARHIHAGQCRAGECDLGKARSLWQLHAYASPYLTAARWRELGGLDFMATAKAAYAAATALGEGERRCRSPVGAIAFYAANRCQWSGAAARLRTYRAVLKKLEHPEPPPDIEQAR